VATGCMCKWRSCHETLNIGVKMLFRKKVANKGKSNARYFQNSSARYFKKIMLNIFKKVMLDVFKKVMLDI
jgi:hypothetical protein